MEVDDRMYPIRTPNGTFENPFDSFHGVGGGNVCRFMRERIAKSISGPAAPTKEEIEANLPVLKPDQQKLLNPAADKIQYMWIGHATVLYQLGGWNVLSDPIWANRCSPFSFLGPKRYRQPPLTIEELPRIDAVVISHNHYDHLCIQSVTELNNRFGAALQWFVPEGLAVWFQARGCEQVTELSWWESHSLKDSSQLHRPALELVCTPAQHWSLRSGFDRNQSLWSSWVIKTPKHSIWFSGDTAYCNAFDVIGRRYGPFDLAAIAIGAYCPRYFMSSQHVDPEHAFEIHKDLKSKLSFGIHWGTFPMGSTEPYMEPKEIIEEIQTEEQSEFPFITVQHGAVNIVE